MSFTIAIDGPSGAGKSTIAKLIAQKLNIIYLDTGAMYRTIGYYCHTRGIDVCSQTENVVNELSNVDVEIRYDNDKNQLIFMNGIDVSQAIRAHHMSKIASDVSKIPQVRDKLVAMQRAIAMDTNVVLDGRDITSNVLPNSKYKFYVTASAETRAMRRYNELKTNNKAIEYSRILEDIIDRDNNDMNRAVAPLVKTTDSILVDTTEMTISEALAYILSYIKE